MLYQIGRGLSPKKTRAMLVSPFAISAYVAIGASITDGAYKRDSVKDLCKDIARFVYGKNITISEHATSGHSVSDQLTALPAILANFTGQSDVVFVDHIGGNDVSGNRPTEFLNLTALQRQQLADDYGALIDAVEAEGHRFIATALTFRDYDDSTLDNDPSAPKVNELGGSYTYNEDWIKPTAVSKGASSISQYEYTRSMYDVMLSADNVHLTDIGDLLFGVHQFTSAMELAAGKSPVSFEEVNFNDALLAPDNVIDIVCAFGANTTSNNPNINWIDVPYGNGDKDIYLTDMIQTDGATSGVSVIISGANKAYPTSYSAPVDASASLANNELLARGVTQSASTAYLSGIIQGLEPNRLYDIEAVHGDVTDFEFSANSVTFITPDGANGNIATVATRADPLGRIVLQCKRASSVGISGLRIRNGSSAPQYSVTVNFANATSAPNINNATASFGTLSNIIDTDGVARNGHDVSWVSNGHNNSGIGNTGDTSNDLTNHEALSNSLYTSGSGTQDTVSFTGFPANRNIKVKFAASRPVSGGRTQDVSVNSGAAVSYDVNDNPVSVIEFDTVTDASGGFTVEITETNGANYSYKGAIQIDVY